MVFIAHIAILFIAILRNNLFLILFGMHRGMLCMSRLQHQMPF